MDKVDTPMARIAKVEVSHWFLAHGNRFEPVFVSMGVCAEVSFSDSQTDKKCCSSEDEKT